MTYGACGKCGNAQEQCECSVPGDAPTEQLRVRVIKGPHSSPAGKPLYMLEGCDEKDAGERSASAIRSTSYRAMDKLASVLNTLGSPDDTEKALLRDLRALVDKHFAHEPVDVRKAMAVDMLWATKQKGCL
jgi:hypothetical protein